MPKAEGFIEVEVVNWKELEAKFARGREFMLGAALTAFRRIGSLLVPALKAETPIGATGHLRNYTVFQVLGKAEDMKLEIRQSAASEKGFMYGVAVRQGTRPHFPPYRALIPWVIRKLGISLEKEAARVAFLVARKISKVGTKPNAYHVRVIDANYLRVVNVMHEEMASMMVRLKP